MIANPAISAGWFPGSDTGYQGVRRVVQDRLMIVREIIMPYSKEKHPGFDIVLPILPGGQFQY